MNPSSNLCTKQTITILSGPYEHINKVTLNVYRFQFFSPIKNAYMVITDAKLVLTSIYNVLDALNKDKIKKVGLGFYKYIP